MLTQAPYEDRTAEERKTSTVPIIEAIVELRLHTSLKIEEIKKQYEDAAKHDKIHKYMGYGVGVLGVAASLVSWPSVWNRIAGQPTEDPSTFQIRFASSGKCEASDIRVGVSRDGLSTVPSKGTACLIVADAKTSTPPTPDNNRSIPLLTLPYGGLGDPFTGKSMLDLLQEGKAVALPMQNGSSVCLKMPTIPCVGAEIHSAQHSKAAMPQHPAHHIRRHPQRHSAP